MLQYYIVDEAGDIDLPVLGKVHVAGLSRPEAERAIKSQLEQQVISPTVLVSLVGAKVSVLGEVNHPSQVPMTNGRMTILVDFGIRQFRTSSGRNPQALLASESSRAVVSAMRHRTCRCMHVAMSIR